MSNCFKNELIKVEVIFHCQRTVKYFLFSHYLTLLLMFKFAKMKKRSEIVL